VRNVSLTEARNGLLRLADEIQRDPSLVVEVQKRGKRVLALVSTDLYDRLLETLDVLADESTSTALRRALREIAKGKGIPWKAARKRLGLPE